LWKSRDGFDEERLLEALLRSPQLSVKFTTNGNLAFTILLLAKFDQFKRDIPYTQKVLKPLVIDAAVIDN
jgi:hypothetical protein